MAPHRWECERSYILRIFDLRATISVPCQKLLGKQVDNTIVNCKWWRYFNIFTVLLPSWEFCIWLVSNNPIMIARPGFRALYQESYKLEIFERAFLHYGRARFVIFLSVLLFGSFGWDESHKLSLLGWWAHLVSKGFFLHSVRTELNCTRHIPSLLTNLLKCQECFMSNCGFSQILKPSSDDFLWDEKQLEHWKILDRLYRYPSWLFPWKESLCRVVHSWLHEWEYHCKCCWISQVSAVAASHCFFLYVWSVHIFKKGDLLAAVLICAYSWISL